MNDVVPCGDIQLKRSKDEEEEAFAEWFWEGGNFLIHLCQVRDGDCAPESERGESFSIDLWVKDEGGQQRCLEALSWGATENHAAEMLYERIMDSPDPDVVRLRHQFVAKRGALEWFDERMFASRIGALGAGKQKTRLHRFELGEGRLLVVLSGPVPTGKGSLVEIYWVQWYGLSSDEAPPAIDENLFLASNYFPALDEPNRAQTWACPTLEAAATICDHWSLGDQVRPGREDVS